MNTKLFVVCFLFVWMAFFSGRGITHAQTEEAAPKAPERLESEEEHYRIGPGDILQILTWKEPDFSVELFVRNDGKITFPLLNEVQAAGLRPMELKRIIEEGLATFIGDPIVMVIVKNPVSQKFYILGEIEKTGEYELRKNLTVLQAIALAEGFTEWASKKEILLIRKENGKEKILRINYKNIIKGKDFDQNIRVKVDDTIIVP